MTLIKKPFNGLFRMGSDWQRINPTTKVNRDWTQVVGVLVKGNTTHADEVQPAIYQNAAQRRRGEGLL